MEIIADIQVGPAVHVQITRYDPQAVAQRATVDSRFSRNAYEITIVLAVKLVPDPGNINNSSP